MTVSNHQFPHDLQLVIDFVNTLDLELETDEIGTPDALTDWLRDRELLGDSAPAIRAVEHADAIAPARGAACAMLANNGEAADPDAGEELERVARAGALGIHFDADGAVTVQPAAAGFDGALARLITPVAAAADDGTWRARSGCNGRTIASGPSMTVAKPLGACGATWPCAATAPRCAPTGPNAPDRDERCAAGLERHAGAWLRYQDDAVTIISEWLIPAVLADHAISLNPDRTRSTVSRWGSLGLGTLSTSNSTMHVPLGRKILRPPGGPVGIIDIVEAVAGQHHVGAGGQQRDLFGTGREVHGWRIRHQ